LFNTFSKDYEVCNCKKVTINEIILSIKEKKIKTLREIQEITGAGIQCRHCIFQEGDFGKIKKKIYCKDILNEFTNG
jgi:bacterioferritin-associated ferredoxin